MQELRQASAFDIFQGEKWPAFVLADLVDLHDIGMTQPGDGPGLGVKAGQIAGGAAQPCQHHLDGDSAIQRELARLVDDAHAAGPEHFLEIAQPLSCGGAWR